ncbi:extracellular solute-binding protein [Acidisoma cellulosilytica]|uniref:Extracellular solute-binding protein n=1 Tax=Acidisoma cellulosilyticum TaxID=2802395 RepID=A0A964E5X8_9PROT|nr:PotD/PotF family extracellular solute-binding protein [Acidisoma cellulosilyticum]MCB8883140.1 extracellular solute-binding protein [Acidisoma cellulosilyticum]
MSTTLAAGATVGAGTFAAPSAQAEDANEVVVLGWVPYWPPEAAALLKKKTGLTLRILGVDTDQEMFTKLKAGGAGQYDLVYANAGWTPLYHKFGLIEPIDPSEIPANTNLYPEFLTTASLPYVADPGKSLLFYPNMWSPLAMVWLPAIVKPEGEPSWTMFWDKSVPKGSVILAGGDGDDFLAIGGLARGVPREQVYAMTPGQLKDVVASMRKLKPFQIVVGAEPEFRARFRRGDATIGLASQIGAAALINAEAKKDIAEAAIPKEGSIGWVDGVMLVKGTKNRANAMKFLNFIGSDVDYGKIIFAATGGSPCSKTVTEALLAEGGDTAQMVKTIQADKPSVAAQIVMQAPPADPNAYAQAWDDVMAT